MPSYSPVFSQGFIYYTASTPNTSFEVPSNFTAVIRYWSVQQEIGGYALELFGQNEVDGPVYVLDYSSGIGAGLVYRNEGRIVIPGGGVINIALSAVGEYPSVYVGGYLLRNTLS